MAVKSKHVKKNNTTQKKNNTTKKNNNTTKKKTTTINKQNTPKKPKVTKKNATKVPESKQTMQSTTSHAPQMRLRSTRKGITVLSQIASGSFGRIDNVFRPAGGGYIQQWARKTPLASEVARQEFQLEAQFYEQNNAILQSLSCLPECVVDRKNSNMFIPIGTSLPDFFRSQGLTLPNPAVAFPLLSLLAPALRNFHSKYFHRDVKLKNVVMYQGAACFVDLAGATPKSDPEEYGQFEGTRFYKPPGSDAFNEHEKNDLYGLAASVVEACTGKPSFIDACVRSLGETQQELKTLILSEKEVNDRMLTEVDSIISQIIFCQIVL